MEAIINDKRLSETDLLKEKEKVLKFKQTDKNTNTFVGNNLLYHFQMEELCKTHRKNKLSLTDIFQDETEIKKLQDQVKKRERTGTYENKMFECWRINNGSITFFKMCNATYLYKKYHATKVLDFTAGWGGRMLGAINLGIEYIGIDTNINLKRGYDQMIELFGCEEKCKMLWQSALEVDYSTLDYDFVFTSPPYEDIEIYSNMGYEGVEWFYQEFLIKLIDEARKYNKGAYTCINISPQMYKKLIEKYKYKNCDIVEDLKEQKNGKTPDNIYIWVN
jgi:16S rRNA G966 N2-methylase RsmD